MISMKIEITAVNAVAEGAQILLTVTLADGEHREMRKLLIFTEQYLSLGLSRGALIDEETLDELISASKLCKAMKKGSDLLSYSPSSRARLKSRLIQKGIDRESAELAAQKLCDAGAIDEERDIERAIGAYMKKLWGKARIRHELGAKGYPSEITSRLLSEIDDDVWVHNCSDLMHKKYKTPPTDVTEQQKMIASIIRYGYSYREIKEALPSLYGQDE